MGFVFLLQSVRVSGEVAAHVNDLSVPGDAVAAADSLIWWCWVVDRGEKAGAQAAYFGKRVAVVERAPAVGGSCIIYRDGASKTLRRIGTLFFGIEAARIVWHRLFAERKPDGAGFHASRAAVVEMERSRS